MRTAKFLLAIVMLILFCLPASAGAGWPRPEPGLPPENLATSLDPVVSDGTVGNVLAIYDEAGLEEVSPAVAYNPDRQEYLVVWYNDRPGNDDVRALRLNAQGARIGGPFYISAGAGAERRYPRVVFNTVDNLYLVVWENYDPTAGYSIKARRVSATGAILDANDLAIAGPGYNLYSPGSPDVAFASTSNLYLVVWHEAFHPSVTTGILGQVLNPNGSPNGGQVIISEDPGGNPRRYPRLAYNRRMNEYLVAWEQYDPGAGLTDIYARRVTRDGIALPPAAIEIARYTVSSSKPSVAAIPTEDNLGQYLVVMEFAYAPGDMDIAGRRVFGEGAVQQLEYLTRQPDDQTLPAVAANEARQKYLAAWTSPSLPPIVADNINARPVGKDGLPSGDEATLGGFPLGNRAAVTAGRLGDFLVVYDDTALSADRGIYGRLWGDRVYLPLVRKD